MPNAVMADPSELPPDPAAMANVSEAVPLAVAVMVTTCAIDGLEVVYGNDPGGEALGQVTVITLARLAAWNPSELRMELELIAATTAAAIWVVVLPVVSVNDAVNVPVGVMKVNVTTLPVAAVPPTVMT